MFIHELYKVCWTFFFKILDIFVTLRQSLHLIDKKEDTHQ